MAPLFDLVHLVLVAFPNNLEVGSLEDVGKGPQDKHGHVDDGSSIHKSARHVPCSVRNQKLTSACQESKKCQLHEVLANYHLEPLSPVANYLSRYQD